jgi:hypothetical protein
MISKNKHIHHMVEWYNLFSDFLFISSDSHPSKPGGMNGTLFVYNSIAILPAQVSTSHPP